MCRSPVVSGACVHPWTTLGCSLPSVPRPSASLPPRGTLESMMMLKKRGPCVRRACNPHNICHGATEPPRRAAIHGADVDFGCGEPLHRVEAAVDAAAGCCREPLYRAVRLLHALGIRQKDEVSAATCLSAALALLRRRPPPCALILLRCIPPSVSTNMQAAARATMPFWARRFCKAAFLFYLALFICIFLKQVGRRVTSPLRLHFNVVTARQLRSPDSARHSLTWARSCSTMDTKSSRDT
jgi:hypothetical protein